MQQAGQRLIQKYMLVIDTSIRTSIVLLISAGIMLIKLN